MLGMGRAAGRIALLVISLGLGGCAATPVFREGLLEA